MRIELIAGEVYKRAKYYRDDMPKRYYDDVKLILQTEHAVTHAKCVIENCGNESVSGSCLCAIHGIDTEAR